LAVLDPAAVATLAWFAAGDLPLVVEPLPPTFTATSVRPVRRLERLGFRNRYARTPWAYAGPLYRTTLDTMRTWRLRGALEARFGPPSETVGDLGADTRLGLGSALRRVAETGRRCVLHRLDGTRHDGVLRRVGAD
ncbi:hypothetical protein, partial [Bradyrhizobium sp. NBAIM08]|uniref:hypothetical protein n=1 Tax=Bradyrhizobium sp. NBAIM08 TaxID=2793815 RepID=UPI001CD71971